MDIPTISDLDRYVSKDRAAELLGANPIYVGALCKQGKLKARKVITAAHVTAEKQGHRCKALRRRWSAGGQVRWTDIDVLSVIMLAAERHTRYLGGGGRHIATPEEVIGHLALPARCPRCDILSDGLCEACRRDLDGAPYWERRE